MSEHPTIPVISSANAFVGIDNSDPPQLWLWVGDPGDETAEPWMRLRHDSSVRLVREEDDHE